jgi:hypothetical protein
LCGRWSVKIFWGLENETNEKIGECCMVRGVDRYSLIFERFLNRFRSKNWRWRTMGNWESGWGFLEELKKLCGGAVSERFLGFGKWNEWENWRAIYDETVWSVFSHFRKVFEPIPIKDLVNHRKLREWMRISEGAEKIVSSGEAIRFCRG